GSGFASDGNRWNDRKVVRRTGCDAVRGLAVAGGLADFELNQVGRVRARITRRTEGALGISDRLPKSLHRYIAERISTKEATDFLGSVGGGDELFFGGCIDAVVAGRNRRWATNAYMDFFRASFADHANNFAGSRAAYDGVVDKDDAPAFDQAADGIELELHAEIADGLRRLDERAADVVVADEAHAEGNLGLERVADGGGNARVRNRD